MSALESASVRRVAAMLAGTGAAPGVDIGAAGRVVELAASARTAEAAAAALGVPVGAIVKSLVFVVGERPVLALVAGDRQCRMAALPPLLGLEGKVKRASAELVREATGFAIGGVPPVAHRTAMPVAIDASLGRFERLHAAAGHPHCVFATSLAELVLLTGGVVSPEVGTLIDPGIDPVIGPDIGPGIDRA